MVMKVTNVSTNSCVTYRKLQCLGNSPLIISICMAIFTNLEIFLVKLVTLVPVVNFLVVTGGSVVSFSVVVVVVVGSTVVPVVVFLVVIGVSLVSPSVLEVVPVVGFLVVVLGGLVSVVIISVVVEVVDSSVVPAVVEGLEVSPLVVAVELADGVGDVGSVEFLILLQSKEP